MQKHPAARRARSSATTSACARCARWVAEHHEKWDGTGYPRRKRAEEISLPGRILGVVEVFDSLATRRSYKEAWELERVCEFFRDQRARAFDPAVLDAVAGAARGARRRLAPAARARPPGARRQARALDRERRRAEHPATPRSGRSLAGLGAPGRRSRSPTFAGKRAPIR